MRNVSVSDPAPGADLVVRLMISTRPAMLAFKFALTRPGPGTLMTSVARALTMLRRPVPANVKNDVR